MRPIYVPFAGAIFLSFALLIPACDTGDKGPTGPSGFTTPACSSPSSQGITTASQATTGYWNGSYVETNAVTLSSNETVTGISVYYTGPVTEQTNFAVYSDNGSGYPANLQFQTNPQNIVSGWNTASVPNVYLPAGTYHMVFNTSFPGNSSYNNMPYTSTGNLNYYGAMKWGLYPTTFPSALTSDAYTIPIYLSTCP